MRRAGFDNQGRVSAVRLSVGTSGSIRLNQLKGLCKQEGVSITKYLTAALIWSLIQVYTDGNTLDQPVALNLPINLRSFFDSETLANFFSVTNIAWPKGKAPNGLKMCWPRSDGRWMRRL